MPAIPHPDAPDRAAEGPNAGDVVVIGTGAAATAITRRLGREGRSVTRLDAITGAADLLAEAAAVVVATRSDGRNLLTAQHLRTRFGLEGIIVLTNDPDRLPAFVDAGHEPICAATAVGDAIAAQL